MYEQTNGMMTETQTTAFLLPNMVASEFSQEDLDEDLDGLSMSFPRVKIPSGGYLQFEVPGGDPENPDYAKNLEGVILAAHPANAYWADTGDDDGEDSPPLCQSVDGKIGYGEPGGLCASCKLNEFGSASKGGGKACKNMRMLYLLRSGDMLPMTLALPPTSLKPYKDFLKGQFTLRKRATYCSLVRIGLKKVEGAGFDYSVATFTLVRDFAGEELAQVAAYAKNFREQLKGFQEERAKAAQASADSLVEVDSDVSALPDNDAHFNIVPGVIDGERMALPA